MKKLFKMERRLAKYITPVARHIVDVPLPDDEYFQAIEDLFERLKGVDQVLMNPEVTAVRLVANPEKVVLKETRRAFMYFSLYKMSIDAVIMNRILPEGIDDAYFKDWIQGQHQRLEQAEDFFKPIPIFPVSQFSGEAIGYDNLKRLADQIYGKKNPVQRFFKEKPYNLEKVNGHYHLKMKLPFVSKSDVELNKFSDELVIRIGGYKRHILLPRQVASYNSVSAKLDNPYLNIFFEGEQNAQRQK